MAVVVEKDSERVVEEVEVAAVGRNVVKEVTPGEGPAADKDEETTSTMATKKAAVNSTLSTKAASF